MMVESHIEDVFIMRKQKHKILEVEPKTLAGRVLQRRVQLGLSQAQLAEQAGSSQQTIQKIEGGIIKRPRNIKALAEALQESPAWLQFGAREIDNLDRDVIMTAVTLQSLPKSLREGFKNAILEASKVRPDKS